MDVCSETSVITSEPMSLNDLPDDILLHILSHFGPQDLCLIAKVSERLNVLAKDVLRKTRSYDCDSSTDISDIKEVSCAALLGFRTNWLMNFAPSSVLKLQNLKEYFRNWTSFHPDVRQDSRGLHCDAKWLLLVITLLMLCYTLDCRFFSFCGQRF